MGIDCVFKLYIMLVQYNEEKNEKVKNAGNIQVVCIILAQHQGSS